MTIYATFKRDGLLTAGAYTGMSQDLVTSLLTQLGATEITFVEESAYLSFVPSI